MRSSPRRSNGLTTGTFFVLFALVWMVGFYFTLFRSSLQEWQITYRLNRSGIDAQAKVLEVRDYGIAGGAQRRETVNKKRIYFVSYQYQAPGPNGRPQRFIQEDRSLPDAAKALKPGSVVRIRYDRENPALARRIDAYGTSGGQLAMLAGAQLSPLLFMAAGVAAIRQDLQRRRRAPVEVATERHEQEQLERLGMLPVVDVMFAGQLSHLRTQNSAAARYIAEVGNEVYLSPDFLPDPADRGVLRDLLRRRAAGGKEKGDGLKMFELLGLLSVPEHERAGRRRQQLEDRAKPPSPLARSLKKTGPLLRIVEIATTILLAAVLVYVFGRPAAGSMVDAPARQVAGLRTLEGHTSSVWDVAFAPDGKHLASASADGTLRIWRLSDGVSIRTLSGHTGYVFGAAFSPDGKYLASASNDKTARLWRVADGAHLRTLNGHTASVVKVTFSPNGQLLASSSEDMTVRVWRVADGKLMYILNGHTGPLYKTTFSPDGSLLATAAKDGTLRLWRAADGTPIRTLLTQEHPITSVAFSRDGAMLAAGSADKTVRVWRVVGWKPLQTLNGPEQWVYDVAFAPDGRTLAAASYDGTVRVWRIGDGAASSTLIGTEGDRRPGIAGIAFAPNGATLAAVGQNRRVFLWAVAR
jgi:WD40 repeat protein